MHLDTCQITSPEPDPAAYGLRAALFVALAWGPTLYASLPRLNPVMRAWKDAQAVTPMIFRG
jgi:hypothetical protein